MGSGAVSAHRRAGATEPDAKGERWLLWHCAGCDEKHGVPVEGGARKWTWNGSEESPTLTPSVLRVTPQGSKPDHRCHLFLRDGKVQFCSDSTHSLAGQTLELPLWEEA